VRGGEAAPDELAEVDRGETVVEPDPVAGGAAEPHSAVAVGDQPGDLPLDHRPVLPVGRLPVVVLGGAAGGEQDVLMRVNSDGSCAFALRPAAAQGATSAAAAELAVPLGLMVTVC